MPPSIPCFKGWPGWLLAGKPRYCSSFFLLFLHSQFPSISLITNFISLLIMSFKGDGPAVLPSPEHYQDEVGMPAAASSKFASSSDDSSFELQSLVNGEEKSYWVEAEHNGPEIINSTPRPSFRVTAHYVLRSILVGMIPSFLLRSRASEPKLRPTSYLDGLRGVAAFFVVLHHFLLDWFPALVYGYGAREGDHWLLQLPWVRIIYAGRGMVSTFFVISGYVLSARSLKLIHSGQFDSVLDCLSSSMFRRGLRLYLPIVGSTFISMIFVYKNWYVHGLLAHHNPPFPLESLPAQFMNWVESLFIISNPFQSVDGFNLYSPPYDGHLWTIPIEFRGSVVVFVTLLALAKVKQVFRILIAAILMLWALQSLHWDIFLFLTGMFLAEIDLVRQNTSPRLPTHSLLRADSYDRREPFSTRRKEQLMQLVSAVLILVATYILGLPGAAEEAYGYRTLMSWAPRRYKEVGEGAVRFWLAVSAMILVIGLSISTPSFDAKTNRQPLFQRPFNTRFAQYLGNISYSIYMMHGPVLETLGLTILRRAMQPEISSGAYTMYFCASAVVNGLILFWISDLFWRHVDARAVEFAKWLGKKFWIKED